ncbi:MAG: type II toxin-antitoxin system Phd/YefM family antitoxin [Deltaproteobacteria bacterium]|nr:type II toxin-antitoxin system Phd/YefM family antitoxin [Deltaproteobacteria bacterium]
MKKTNALHLRQNMGKIVDQLLKTGEPILLEKGRKPVAVLISMEDYQTRFVDREADELRKQIVQTIRNANIKLPTGNTSLDLIRDVRS